MKENKLKPLRGMFVLFVLLSVFFVLQQKLLVKWNFDADMLIVGNLVIVIVTLVSYLLVYKSLQSANPNSFVRAMYLGFILKFFILAISAFIYIMAAKKQVSKPSLIACACLYLLYTFIEVAALTKLLKQKKNA